VDAALAGDVLLPDPGVVDDDVEALPGRDDVPHELARVLGPADVSRERHRLSPGVPDLADRPVGRGLVAYVGERHAGAGAGEEVRDRAADPPRAAGHQRRARGEVDRETLRHFAPYIKLEIETFHRDRAATATRGAVPRVRSLGIHEPAINFPT